MRPVAVLSLSASLALLVTQLPGQGRVADRALTKADGEFAESFDQVISLRELPGGKVLVTDVGPRSVLLADFGSGNQVTVGRNGQGPGEYQFPGDLIPLPGDSTLIVDRGSRRFLLVGPDGKIGKTVPFPDGLPGFPEAHGADAQGRIYFTGSLLGAPGAGAPTLPDSLKVVRWDRARGTLDTVGTVKAPALKMQVSGGANSRSVMVRPQPFAAQDDWAVAPDGRVAVVRSADYHLDWVTSGASQRGAPVRYQPVKVTSADRTAFVTALRGSRNRVTVNVGGGGRNLPPPEVSEEDFDWPEVKAPFVARSTLMAPEGEVWVQRYKAASDSTPTFDVFDGKGNLTAAVTLPLGRRLVGLGKGTAYAVRTDQDGLQWLERYRR